VGKMQENGHRILDLLQRENRRLRILLFRENQISPVI